MTDEMEAEATPGEPPDVERGVDSPDHLEERVAHAEDQWRRAAADLENLRKRFDR